MMEVFQNLTVGGWLNITPENCLNEIAETMKRIDTEPKFFTFNSFSNMGNETMKKLTDNDFTNGLDLDKKENFDFEKARAREGTNDKILEFMFDQALNGKTKEDVIQETQEKFPKAELKTV